jgi:broad specificity phosphatase PhoE
VDPDRPTSEWSLSAEGVSRCETIASELERFLPAVMFSSPETKAVETAQHVGLHLGIEFSVREGLCEHRRPAVFLPQSEFHDSIRGFFAVPDSIVYGSESSNDVAKRIEAEVRRALVEHPEGNILMVTHGTAMTSFTSYHTDADAYSLWQSLDLPAHIAFGLPSFDIVDSVGTVL